MTTLTPVRTTPAPPPAVLRAAAAVSPADPQDLVIRPVAFEPEVRERDIFANRPLQPETVAYYDAAADAQDRAKYYGDLAGRLPGMDGKSLFAHLGKLVTSTHRPLDYEPEDHLYPWVDRRPTLQLDSVYNDKAENGPQADPGGLWILADGEGPSTLVFSEREGRIYNCEHVVPQSWFNKKSIPRADLHHLFTCDIDCNSLRGNSVYFEFQGGGDDTMVACGITDESRKRFEPYGGKGAVARAVLYFLMRYPGEIGDERGEFTPKDLDMLKKWSRENPVSQYELHRNRAIQQKQGNRNPLVDFPQLVDRIDFTPGFGRLKG